MIAVGQKLQKVHIFEKLEKKYLKKFLDRKKKKVGNIERSKRF